MLVEIEAYLTHVIKTANPTKLIFIAIDGVAPQAKISQQRQYVGFLSDVNLNAVTQQCTYHTIHHYRRRFRAAKEATEVKFKKERFIKEARGAHIFSQRS